MSELYENLLKATSNIDDITTEKYGIITKLDGLYCSVKETDNELEHNNVPIVNGANLKLGDKVLIGFLNNSIYDIVCYGVLDRTVETDWENVKDKPSTFPPSSHNHVSSEVTDLINTIYPVGSIYMNINPVSPDLIFGGEWVRIKDKFLLSAGDNYNAGDEGGEATHTLTENEMPSHTHIQDSHNHTQNAHNHTQNPHSHTIGSLARYDISGKGVAAVGDGYGNVQNYKTGNTTATNKEATATNKSAIATNQNTGGGQAHNNMPPYLVVNVWKRTA